MIKIVCAWCGKVIREGSPEVNLVSHLICPECFEKELQRFREETGDPAARPEREPDFGKASEFEDKD